MEAALQELNQGGGWDWCIRSFDGYALSLSAGSSVDYAQPVAEFRGVIYISCPTEFSHPAFRLSTAAERQHVATLVPLDDEDNVIAIEAESMSNCSSHVFFIVAQSLVLNRIA